MKFVTILFFICLWDLGYVVANVPFMWAKIMFGVIFAVVFLAYFMLVDVKKMKLKD